MSTYEQVLCDYQDVQFVAPRIADYDLKRQVQGWTVHSGSVYKSAGHGSADQLYRDGIELGAVQSALVDVDADG